MRNHNVQHLLPATFIIMALMGGAADAQAQTWVQAGMLRCRLNPSIGFVIFGHQSMECGFQPVSGPVQAYEGAINTVGIDLGVSEGGRLAWITTACCPPERILTQQWQGEWPGVGTSQNVSSS
jgi:hypothetical protein